MKKSWRSIPEEIQNKIVYDYSTTKLTLHEVANVNNVSYGHVRAILLNKSVPLRKSGTVVDDKKRHIQYKKAAEKISNTKKTKNIIKNDENSNDLNFHRNFVLERDGKRCRHCGSAKNIEVHHVDPFAKSKNNHYTNLITLCKSCHMRAEEIRGMNRNKKGIILAGGSGSRLQPLTMFHSKHELPLGTVPMIFWPLFSLRDLDVNNVTVVLDVNGIGNIPSCLGGGKQFGMNLNYIVQDGPKGIADALLKCRYNLEKEKDGFFVILGDNIFSKLEFNRNTLKHTLKNGCVFLKEVSNPFEYGVADIKDYRIISIEEKPKIPKSNFAVTGLYFYKPKIFSILDNLTPSQRDELEISDLNHFLAMEDDLDYRMIKNPWFDAGHSHYGYIEAQNAKLSEIYNEL